MSNLWLWHWLTDWPNVSDIFDDWIEFKEALSKGMNWTWKLVCLKSLLKKNILNTGYLGIEVRLQLDPIWHPQTATRCDQSGRIPDQTTRSTLYNSTVVSTGPLWSGPNPSASSF